MAASQSASNIIKLSSPATREFWPVPVLYEDDYLLALDKPSRLLSSPDRYDPERPNLMKLLHRDIERGATWAVEHRIRYLANVHRLDFETSGIILLAKDKPTLTALTNLFGSEKPLKVYAALVLGSPQEETFNVSAKLAPHPFKPGLMRVNEKRGKKAVTQFEVMEPYQGYTLLQCRPLTDRTHQIRVHLNKAGLPLVGDPLYGGHNLFLSRLKPNYRFKPDQPELPLIGRTALHAEKLELPHPVTGALLSLNAPWPKDLTVAVKYLRKFAS